MAAEAYNYDTFRRHMMRQDMHFHGGPAPGEFAYPFDLPTTSGSRFRLEEFRGKQPVLLEFGSITCPMTLGARSCLRHLFNRFGQQVKFVSVYVREAHPGERYPHHVSDEQKMRHARDWVEQDKVPWTVAVDSLDGMTHRAYGALPNPAYLIDRTGHVAFRMLWAGQEFLLGMQIEELLRHEAAGEDPVNLGQEKNLVIPMIHGAAEFDRALGRGGEKSKEDFRREMGDLVYALEELMSKLEPVINPGNQ